MRKWFFILLAIFLVFVVWRCVGYEPSVVPIKYAVDREHLRMLHKHEGENSAIADMKIGDMGYTGSWAIFKYHGEVYVDLAFPVYIVPNGADIMIERRPDGFYITSTYKNEVDYSENRDDIIINEKGFIISK